jgi:ferredoxin
MIDKGKCIGCGTCVAICPVGAISFDTDGRAKIDKDVCMHCGSCQASCPVDAISLD